MSRPAELTVEAARCSSKRRCRSWSCKPCGPIRSGDEFRKFRDNLVAYGGRIMLVAVTGPGKDVLPWDGAKVDANAAFVWNMTASKRFARMLKGAQVAADRQTRRSGWRGDFPRVVARAWSPQKRGIWHVHLALPAETQVELGWSRTVVRFLDAAQRSERETRSATERRTLLELEHYLEASVRSFYGWGFVDRNAARRLGSVRGELGAVRAAQYMARNVARYLGENAAEGVETETRLPGRSVRSHVSVRLTRLTGVTIRNLRRARYLFVCITRDLPLPDWPDELLKAVWLLLAVNVAVARGP